MDDATWWQRQGLEWRGWKPRHAEGASRHQKPARGLDPVTLHFSLLRSPELETEFSCSISSSVCYSFNTAPFGKLIQPLVGMGERKSLAAGTVLPSPCISLPALWLCVRVLTLVVCPWSKECRASAVLWAWQVWRGAWPRLVPKTLCPKQWDH